MRQVTAGRDPLDAGRFKQPRSRQGRPFFLRWIVAITVSMIAAAVIEYTIAVDQLEERSLAEAANGYAADLDGLAVALAADLSPAARKEAVEQELQQVAGTYGTRNVVLFGADGRLLTVTAHRPEDLEKAEVREVLSSGRPSWDEEVDGGEAGEANRYEFLLPINTPDGQAFVVEVDQRADIIGRLLADLRQRKIYGLLLGLLVAVPLSYLLGGRSLYRRQSRAQHAADTDALTGLASRRPFRPLLQSALDGPAAGSTVLALIDVDEFKLVNDRLGHSYGDRVLCALADAFGGLRACDTAFRLGGDEFAVVLTQSHDEHAAAAIERVRQALSQSVPGVTFSAGIAGVMTGEDPVGLQELWERADTALYEAKRRGRRQTVCFNAMSSGVTVSADKLDAIATLLSDDAGLSVAFQPVWDLCDGHLLGHEALLRLPVDSPVGGTQEAFELAQRLGMAAALDTMARRAVLRVIRRQDWRGLLFLNVHPDALPGLDVDALVTEITDVGLASAQVVLEVTEHDGLDGPEPIRVLKRAQSRGFRLALDDMGAGNAGLRALTHVRFDVVKLDRQVTARLGLDPASDATVAAAITYVQQTGGCVIAEGIEDADRLNAVRAAGAFRRPPSTTPMIAGQGYFLGRPAPATVAPETPLNAITPAPAVRAVQ